MYGYDTFEREEMVTFDLDARDGVAGNASDGLIVFVDNCSFFVPKRGETWKVHLRRNPNICKQNYFATLIEKQTTEMPKEEPSPVVQTSDYSVRGNLLISERLTDGSYSVYRSFNGEILEIIPDPKGCIKCTDHALRLDGLQDLDVTQHIMCQHPKFENGFLIKLEA